MVIMVLAVLLAACSPKRLAVDLVGSAMVGGGDSYATDNDPDLVKEALPFGLKTIESLLAVSPDNRNLLLAAARSCWPRRAVSPPMPICSRKRPTGPPAETWRGRGT
jgi:hypothetical protein